MRKSKNIIKSITVISLIFLIIFTSFVPAQLTANAATGSPDVKLVTYEVSKTNITAGSEFNMYLTLENISSEDITDVKIGVDAGSPFSLKNNGYITTLDNIIKPNNQSSTYSWAYYYNGDSNKLQIVIKYKKNGKDYQQEDSITISEAVPKDDTPSTPVDTSKYAPKIVIANNTTIPTGSAGSNITYTLPLKNSSIYAAKNIVITPVLDESSPFVVESMNSSQTLDSLQPNETKNISFKFKISNTVQVKNYPIKFNIECQNYSNDSFSSSITGYLKIIVGAKQPKIVLGSVTTNPSQVQAGEKFKLNVVLSNNGSTSAKDVNVTLLGLKTDGASILGSSNKQTKSNIYINSSETFTFDLSASPKIEAGSNSLKIKIDYKDSSNSTYSDELEVFYYVESAASSSNIQIKNLVSPNGALSPGTDASISFDIANSGAADARNVKINISAGNEIVPKSLNTIILPVLKKGETRKVDFKLSISDDAVTKNYPVAINIEYDADNSGTKQTFMQYVGLYVENGSGKSIPRLIIDSYSLEPGSVNAGENFILKLSILNTSSSQEIKNVKVSISSDDGTFTTMNSNSFYIDSVAPKGSVQKQLEFSSKSDAAPKQYMISINYEYEDSKGTALTSKDVIGIPVQQTPRLVLGDISFPPEAYVGNPIPVNLSFYNMGKSTLYNLMVKLEGNFKVEGTSYFVGNFEPGKTDSFDGMINPQEVGQAAGSVIFTYEDATGKTQEIRKDISLNVMEMPVIDGNMGGEGQMPPPVEQGKKIPTWAFVVGGVVLCAVILTLTLIVRRKIKKRKESMFDEEI